MFVKFQDFLPAKVPWIWKVSFTIFCPRFSRRNCWILSHKYSRINKLFEVDQKKLYGLLLTSSRWLVITRSNYKGMCFHNKNQGWCYFHYIKVRILKCFIHIRKVGIVSNGIIFPSIFQCQSCDEMVFLFSSQTTVRVFCVLH